MRLRLDCVQPPDEPAARPIDAVRQQIAFQEIAFDVRVVPDLAKG